MVFVDKFVDNTALFHQRKKKTMKKELTLVYGDSLMIYCFDSVSRLDTIARLAGIVPHVVNTDIRTQMLNLRDKISEEMDDADWAEYFPKILRNMAVYLDRDKEIFQRRLEEMVKEKPTEDYYD